MNTTTRLLAALAILFTVVGAVVWGADAASVHAHNSSGYTSEVTASIYGLDDGYRPAHENHTAPIALWVLAAGTATLAVAVRKEPVA